jgi:hypothetical protein
LPESQTAAIGSNPGENRKAQVVDLHVSVKLIVQNENSLVSKVWTEAMQHSGRNHQG